MVIGLTGWKLIVVTSASVPTGRPFDVAPGENQLLITVVSDGGVEVVECSTTLVGDCELPTCAVRPPEEWHDIDCP